MRTCRSVSINPERLGDGICCLALRRSLPDLLANFTILNGLGYGSGLHLRPSAISGTNWPVRDLGSLTMFQIPAYDPVAIAMMGFGALLVAALAFVL